MTHDWQRLARDTLAQFVELPNDPDTPLELESLTLVEIVEALEEKLGIRIRAGEITPEHFGSEQKLLRFLATKANP